MSEEIAVAPALGMNEKGILFSLMVLVLLGAILSLHYFSIRQDDILKETSSEANAFQRVSDKYANVKNNLKVLTTSEAEKDVDQRILPFEYDINGNRNEMSTELPSRQERTDAYLEILNAFRVFLEDSSFANEFDGLHSDVNIIVPESWGGTSKNVSFLLEPQCMKYSILDSNTLEFSVDCPENSYMEAVRQDINLTFRGVHDFNSIACSFNGSGLCFSSNYNSNNPLPYVSVDLNTADCYLCSLSQATISGHFDPAQASTIIISCIGAGCTTPDLSLNFGGITRMSYSGQRIDVNMGIDFNAAIESFSFNDANILIENRHFNAKRGG